MGLKIALCRLGLPVTCRSNALERLAETYRQAVARKADLVVFPELILPTSGKRAGSHGEIFLRPNDLKILAKATGNIPMLHGGITQPRVPRIGRLGSPRVHELANGKVRTLDQEWKCGEWIVQEGEWLNLGAHRIEIRMLSNYWTGRYRFHEDLDRTNALMETGAVGIDFHREKRPLTSSSLPLEAYWQFLTSKSPYDPTANGLIRLSPDDPGRWQSDWGDGCLIVDPTTLDSGKARRRHAKSPAVVDEADKSPPKCLVLGCLTRLPMQIGEIRLRVEIQRIQRQFLSGMMFREPLAEDEGMLFIVHQPQPVSFYMANTPSPLSIAYIDPAGRILQILDLEPFDRTSRHSSHSNVQYALEMRQGWFRDHGVGVGSYLLLEDGPLQDAFLTFERTWGCWP